MAKLIKDLLSIDPRFRPSAKLSFKRLTRISNHIASISKNLHSNPSTRYIWKKINTIGLTPQKRSYHAGVLYNGKLYIFGGFDVGVVPKKSYRMNDVHELDIATKTWRPVVTTGKTPMKKSGHTAVLWGDQMVIFAGKLKASLWTNELHFLDLKTFKWTEKQPPKYFFLGSQNRHVPAPRSSHSAVMYGSYMIVFGGYQGMNSFFCDVHQYDFTKNIWSEIHCIGEVPEPRHSHSACVHNNTMYVFGGLAGKVRLNDLRALNLISKTWHCIDLRGDIPTRRSGHKAEVHGNYIYIYGGWGAASHSPQSPGRYFSETYKINCNTYVIERLEIDGYQCPQRSNHVSVSDKRCMYVWGGYADHERKNDFHVFNFGLDIEEEMSVIKRLRKKQFWDTCFDFVSL